jgi:hypothetical protein
LLYSYRVHERRDLIAIIFLVLTTQFVSLLGYTMINVNAQTSFTEPRASIDSNSTSIDSGFGLEEAYTVPLNTYNESSLAPTAGQPKLLERVPTEALQPSQPFFGQPTEIKEPGVRNETDITVDQSEAQTVSNQTLNQELQNKTIVSFQNITNASSIAPRSTTATSTTSSAGSPLIVSPITGFKGID